MHGTKKALVITNNQSAYLEKSDVYILGKNGKVKKYLSLSGALTKYTSNKKQILISCYYGSGMGNYKILKYNIKSKKYVKEKSYDYETNNRDGSSLKKAKTVSLSGRFDNTVSPAKVKKRVCKIDSKKISYAKYKKYITSFSYSKLKAKNDSQWGFCTLKRKNQESLPDFCDRLKK